MMPEADYSQPKREHLVAQDVAILGAGSWATALSQVVARNGHRVTLWGRDVALLNAIKSSSVNSRYFPGISLRYPVETETDLGVAVRGKSSVVFAIPSIAVRSVVCDARGYLDKDTVCISVVKGLEADTLLRMTEVIEESTRDSAGLCLTKQAVLSGPSFAEEVLNGLPTAITLAACDERVRVEGSRLFHNDSFRVYTSSDVLGVEVGGVFKNIVAIAVGIVDELGFGLNARAALITRGIAEMRRLVLAMNGRETTVAGLSGIGDLVLTCTGALSRNRQVGIRLARGEKLESILQHLGQVAEGVINTENIINLAKRYGVDLPISVEVSRVLQGEPVKDSVERLLNRQPKAEFSA